MPAPGGILGLDLSFSSSGYAYGGLGERPVFGHHKIGSLERPGRAYSVLEDYCDDWIRLFRPRAVVYEAPLPTNRNINKNSTTRQTNETAIGSIRLGGIVELICDRHDVPCYHQHCGQARSAVLGRAPTGGADVVKPIIIAWAKARGWDVACSDEGDALVLVQFSVVKLDRTGQAHFLKHGATL